MLGKLLLLFTVVPVAELYLLITIGQNVGAEVTIAIVLITGMLGASLAKREGSRVWRNWQGAVARGQIPKDGVISSLLVLVGGVLLVTPGVLTDITGLLLLIPWSRRGVASMLRSRLEHRFEMHSFGPGPAMGGPWGPMGGPGAQGPHGPVIDVDVVEAEVVDSDVVEAEVVDVVDVVDATASEPNTMTVERDELRA